MQRLITVSFLDIHNYETHGDALVEFIQYEEDEKIINEVTEVYLPENVPQYERQTLRLEITKRFHDGEGDNL